MDRGHHLVPHAQVLQAIKNADMGLICYPPNPSTRGSIPTKLYEYLGQSLPILLINHNSWIDLCRPFDAAVSFTPKSLDANDLLHEIQSKTFYSAPASGIFWEDEVPKLLAAIHSLIV